MILCYRCNAAKAVNQCACGALMCGRDSFYRLDESNAAITRSARPHCGLCSPPKYPRPFEMARAVEQDEWFIE